MRARPDRTTILAAVARFLEAEVRPALAADKRLAFRVLIAAHLAGVMAAETMAEETQVEGELERLVALLPDVQLPKDLRLGSDRAAAVTRLTRELVRRLHEGRLDTETHARAWQHARQTLREELAVVSPRFDTELDLD